MLVTSAAKSGMFFSPTVLTRDIPQIWDPDMLQITQLIPKARKGSS